MRVFLIRPFREKSTNALARLLFLLAVSLGCLLASPALIMAQEGSGQGNQAPSRERKRPQTDDALKLFLPREASIRFPERYRMRGGFEPGSASHFPKGEAEYRAGRNAAAIPELRQAVKESPSDYDSHYLLALTLTETGELKEAIEEFKKAIAVASQDDPKIVAFYNMANAYFDLGDYQNAADAYQSSLKIDAALSKVHNNLALALVGSKRTSDAATEFKRAVDLKPQYAEAQYNLGVAYLQLGKKSDAEEVMHTLAGINAELAEKLKQLINP